MLDLKTLSAVLGQALVVRYVGHQVGHVEVERFYQLNVRDLLVFDGVVQIAGSDQVCIGPGVGQ